MRKNIHLLTVLGALTILPALACMLPSIISPSSQEVVITPATPIVVMTPMTGLIPDENPPSEGCVENKGKIVFSYDPGDLAPAVHYGIYLMDADGGNRIRLSSPDAYTDRHPAWSPDRCWIAFTRSIDGNDDIYAMSADGKTVRRLTSDAADDMFPDWSPDGTQISFISYRDEGYRNLFVMNADGSDQRQVTDQQMLPKTKGGYVQWEQWSPKGDEIAFVYNPGADIPGASAGIYVIRPDGSGLRQIHSRGLDLAWSTDGDRIFFLDSAPHPQPGMEIWVINRDGSGLRQLSNFGGEVVHPDHSLRVSPTGNQLAFYGVGPEVTEYGSEIYVINTDGSGFKNISHAKGQDEWLDW